MDGGLFSDEIETAPEFKSPTAEISASMRRLNVQASSSDDDNDDGKARLQKPLKRDRGSGGAVVSDSDSDGDPAPGSAVKRTRGQADAGADPEPPSRSVSRSPFPEAEGVGAILTQLSALLDDSDDEPAQANPAPKPRRRPAKRKPKTSGRGRLSMAADADSSDGEAGSAAAPPLHTEGARCPARKTRPRTVAPADESSDQESDASAQARGGGGGGGGGTSKQRRLAAAVEAAAAAAPSPAMAEAKRALDPAHDLADTWHVARAGFPVGRAVEAGRAGTKRLLLRRGDEDGQLCSAELRADGEGPRCRLQILRSDTIPAYLVVGRTWRGRGGGRLTSFDAGAGPDGRKSAIARFAQLYRAKTGVEYGDAIRGAAAAVPGKMRPAGGPAGSVRAAPVPSSQAAPVVAMWDRLAAAVQPAAVAESLGLDRARTAAALAKGTPFLEGAMASLRALESEIRCGMDGEDDEPGTTAVPPTARLAELTRRVGETMPLSRAAVAEPVTSLLRVAELAAAAVALDAARAVQPAVRAATAPASAATAAADALTAATGVLLTARPLDSGAPKCAADWVAAECPGERVGAFLEVGYSGAWPLEAVQNRRMAWWRVSPAAALAAVIGDATALAPSSMPSCAAPFGRGCELRMSPRGAAAAGRGDVVLLVEVACGTEVPVPRPRYYARPPAGHHSLVVVNGPEPAQLSWPESSGVSGTAAAAPFGIGAVVPMRRGSWTGHESAGDVVECAEPGTSPAVVVFDSSQLRVRAALQLAPALA